MYHVPLQIIANCFTQSNLDGEIIRKRESFLPPNFLSEARPRPAIRLLASVKIAPAATSLRSYDLRKMAEPLWAVKDVERLIELRIGTINLIKENTTKVVQKPER